MNHFKKADSMQVKIPRLYQVNYAYLVANKRFDEAEFVYGRAIEAFKGLQNSYYFEMELATLLIKREKYYDAIELLESSKKKYPGNADICFSIGYANQMLGNNYDAISNYRLALTYDSKHKNSLEMLEHINEKNNNVNLK